VYSHTIQFWGSFLKRVVAQMDRLQNGATRFLAKNTNAEQSALPLRQKTRLPALV
jgi:hypothetical protein